MTPKFWKYLIAHGDGSAIRFVAEEDRDWAEKELEGDPCLLSYTAKPQFGSAVFRCPAEAVLRRLRRTRLHLQRMEVNHMHDSVVTINNTHWPAYRKENGTLVDLRILDPEDRSPKPRLVFRPDALRKSGIPEGLIEAATRSDPPGLILFEDVPQFKGCNDQPTSVESTR
ncbi:MAG: hypothetical protein DMG30_20455 [Acidobacteria bacterium]|nr:MAG: hypothetical protein DMG30_20455 [Acidobacteriota bacterium]